MGEVCNLTKGKRAVADEAGRYPVYGAGSKATKKTDKANAIAPFIRVTAKATLGEVYLHTEDCWVEEAGLIIQPKEGLELTYLYHWLKKNQSIISRQSNGGIIPSLDLERLAAMPFELPSLVYQAEVCAILGAMAQEIHDLQKYARLNEQRGKQMKEAMLDF